MSRLSGMLPLLLPLLQPCRWRSAHRRVTAILLTLAVLFPTVALGSGGQSGSPAVAAAAGLSWEQKGFAIPAWGPNDLYNSGPALEQLAATGGTFVTFMVTWYTHDASDTAIFRMPNTATDESVVWAIQKAKSLGLRVGLKPHVDRLDNGWRAEIMPSNIDQWFQNYGAMIHTYGHIAAQQGVDVLSIGSELGVMQAGVPKGTSINPAYEGRWRTLIAELRSYYGGKLTYNANFGPLPQVDPMYPGESTVLPFWDALDYIGISAYFNVAEPYDNTPTIDGMKQKWQNWLTSSVAPLQQRWGKPVLFTEGGYRSVDGAAWHPWDSADWFPLDLQEQADAYEALFEFWQNVPWLAGAWFMSWNIDTNVSGTSIGYEVQNKPAYSVVRNWYGGAAPAAPTATPMAPTATSVPPTATSVPPTATATATMVTSPTATSAPSTATATGVPTGVPSTATAAATATASPIATGVPATVTTVPATATASTMPPTSTAAPTQTGTSQPPTASVSVPTSVAASPTSTPLPTSTTSATSTSAAIKSTGPAKQQLSESQSEARVGVCHATGSDQDRYVYIEVDQSALSGHQRHAGDLVGVSADQCPVEGRSAGGATTRG